ncbi:MAG: ATP synthase F1 subunit delta [Bacillota bacterium]|nr:ATP synthase F1 subunit delta [Bacillota bacterium]
MRENSVAGRYALALFEVAEANALTKEIEQQLDTFAAQMLADSSARHLFCGRDISAPAKKQMLGELYGGVFHPFVLNFLSLVLDKGREGMIEAMIDIYKQLHQQKLGVLPAVLTTAHPLSDDRADALGQSLSRVFGKTVSFERRVNAGIIGGAIINIGDKTIDGSVKAGLRNLRRELIK